MIEELQSVTIYKTEQKAVTASINRLHAEIWLQKENVKISELRQKICEHTRRLKTIEHVIRWLKIKTD